MNNIESYSEQEIYEDATLPEFEYLFKNAGEDAIYGILFISEFFPDQLYVMIRHAGNWNIDPAYVSLFEPKYLGSGKLTKEAKYYMIKALNENWNKIKSDEFFKDKIPERMPDYSNLETI